MGATITLRDVPEHIYQRLKHAAEVHNRSIAGEALACLEQVLPPGRLAAGEHLARAAEIRARFAGRTFSIDDLNAAIDHGRT
jgi:antitoxin FitA